MEQQEVTNTEVVETAEVVVANVAKSGSKTGILVAAGIGLALLVGGIVYKKVIAPARAKKKALKEAPEVAENTKEDIADIMANKDLPKHVRNAAMLEESGKK